MCTPNGTNAENTESELDVATDTSSDTDDSDATSDSSNASGDEVASSIEEADQVDELEDEDDEIIQTFRRAKEIQRNHPPDINCDDMISDISFHTCNHIIAAASIVGDVFLFKYSNENNELADTLEIHTKACRSVEFSLDGESIFTASQDKSWIISDVATGKMKRVEEDAHEDPIYKLKIIDENRVVTGDENGVVKVWDLRQQGSVFSLKEMEDYVSDMVTNESKRYLVCSSGEGTITTINLIEQRMHVQSEPYEAELSALGLVKNERKLVASSSKGRLYIFNWGEFGYHSDELPGPKMEINCMMPLTENIVVTGSEDGILRATHLFPHRHLGIVGQHRFPVEQLDVSGDGELLASCSHDDSIKFWNIKYLEDVHISDREKADSKKSLRHNLPSSSAANTSDFFADMADN